MLVDRATTGGRVTWRNDDAPGDDDQQAETNISGSKQVAAICNAASVTETQQPTDFGQLQNGKRLPAACVKNRVWRCCHGYSFLQVSPRGRCRIWRSSSAAVPKP